MMKRRKIISMPVRVLQIAPLQTGGITSLVLSIAEQVDTDKVVFDYLTFRNRVEFNEARACANGSRKYVVAIDGYKNTFARAVFKFFHSIKVFRSCNADVLHINGSVPYDCFVGVSAKIAGVKSVIFHSHTSDCKRKAPLFKLAQNCFRAMIPLIADEYMACSESAARYMFPKSVLKSGNYRIIKNGICTEKFLFSEYVRQEYRRKLGIADKMVIGHVGRFVLQKNHIFMIDIFEKILLLKPDSYLVFVGEGPLADEVALYIEKRGLSGNVCLLGRTDEVYNILQAFDAFLMPSLYEGLPISGVEAQASGLPCVFSDTITEELKITDLASYVSLQEPAEHWAEILLQQVQLHSSDDRSRYAEEVKKAGFDIQATADELTDLYLQRIK